MHSFVHKAENTIASWFKPLPHLPGAGRKWLAENVWWIVLVGAIATSISVLVQLGGIFTAISAISSAAVWLAYYVGSVYSWWGVVVQIISTALFALVAIMMWLAIKPLQDVKKQGWNILFLVVLVQLAIVLITNLLSFGIFSIFSIVFGALVIAVGAYFLFEIQPHFAVEHKKVSKPATKKTTKKKS